MTTNPMKTMKHCLHLPFALGIAAATLLSSHGQAQLTTARISSPSSLTTSGSTTLVAGSTTWTPTTPSSPTEYTYVQPTISQKSADSTHSFGVLLASGAATAQARVEDYRAQLSSSQDARRFEAYAGVRGSITLLGRSYEAGLAYASGRVRNGTWTQYPEGVAVETFKAGGRYEVSGRIRLAGLTQFTFDQRGTTDFERRIRQPIGLADIMSCSQTFWIGPVPVTVSAKAGANADLDLGLELRPVDLKVAVNGGTGTYAYASGQVGVGAWCASAGIRMVVRFADTDVDFDVGASAINGMSGSLSYSISAIRLLLQLYASWCTGSGSLTVFDESYLSVSGSENLL